MRISELITELERVKLKKGDIPVVVEGQLGYFESENIAVVEIDKYSFVDFPRGVIIS